MVSRGFGITAARRRMETESETEVPLRDDMDLHVLRKMEELWPCDNVVMPEWGEAGKEGFVCAAVCEVAVCLFVSVGVIDVGGFVAEGGEEGIVLAGKAGAECGGDGVDEGEGGDVME
jgi:hypothetical protein